MQEAEAQLNAVVSFDVAYSVPRVLRLA